MKLILLFSLFAPALSMAQIQTTSVAGQSFGKPDQHWEKPEAASTTIQGVGAGNSGRPYSWKDADAESPDLFSSGSPLAGNLIKKDNHLTPKVTSVTEPVRAALAAVTINSQNIPDATFDNHLHEALKTMNSNYSVQAAIVSDDRATDLFVDLTGPTGQIEKVLKIPLTAEDNPSASDYESQKKLTIKIVTEYLNAGHSVDRSKEK